MRAIVVGAGGATRDLLRRLGELWDVTVIDPDPERLEAAADVREALTILGDGSSRVVLQRAGIGDADALVAATNDDGVNLEACRIARQAGLLRVVAVAAAPERIAEYRQLQVPAFAPDSLAARQVELNLEPRRVSSTAFAHGRAEAIEFRIAPDSPVRGVPLMDLHSESWLVAAILREDSLIIPHGDTVLESGDLVTVVGAAADFSHIVRMFTSGEARFPLDFGKRAAVALDSAADLRGPVAEAIHFTRNSPATSLLVMHRRPESVREDAQAAELAELLERLDDLASGVEMNLRPVDGPPDRALPGIVRGESVGVVVLPAPKQGTFGLFRAVRALRRAVRLGRPVLFSRGTTPYQHVVTPARDTPAGGAAARAAIDLAAYGKGQVSGVAVVSPAFLTGVDGRDAALRALTRLREEAAVQSVPVRRRLRQGNPVRVLDDASKGAGLVVLGLPERTPSWWRPGIDGHLLARTEASTLVVPFRT
jgi:Trk K+ transport system NAD-binding subunit